MEITTQKQLLEQRLQYNESSMEHFSSAQEASKKEIDLLKNKLQSSESELKESADKVNIYMCKFTSSQKCCFYK